MNRSKLFAIVVDKASISLDKHNISTNLHGLGVNILFYPDGRVTKGKPVLAGS